MKSDIIYHKHVNYLTLKLMNNLLAESKLTKSIEQPPTQQSILSFLNLKSPISNFLTKTMIVNEERNNTEEVSVAM